MKELVIELENGRTVYRPGDTISGRVRWHRDDDVRSAEVRLGWFTQGKGTGDGALVEAMTTEHLAAQGTLPFRFILPEGPWSFSGALVTLAWTIELVLEPGHDVAGSEILLTPSGSEIRLADATAVNASSNGLATAEPDAGARS